jgi:beta-carotene hydroxylase
MPFLYAGGFMASWHLGYSVWAAICLILCFSATSTSTHDVLHGSLGLNRRQTEWCLCLLGLSILQSGHAYRATHLHHHRVFPSHSDLEGEAAHWPLWRVVLSGPLFLPRLWGWAYRERPEERRWLILEGLALPAVIVLGLLLLPLTSAVLGYALVVLVAGWWYPVFAVWLPHRNEAPRPELRAWTTRGWLIPRLFRPLAFHLEHHLYPKVPSHNLPLLSQRLDGLLRGMGVEPVTVP